MTSFRRAGLAIGLGLLLAAVLVSALRPFLWRTEPASPATPPAPAEALLKDLVAVEGRMHLAGESNGFTGNVVEYYPWGAMRSKSVMVEGQLHGLSQGWHTNGQLQVTETFERNVSHGLRSKFYSDGQKQSEAQIVQGQLGGAFRRWHPNGQLAEQMEMRDGNPQGQALAWYPSGSLKSKVVLRDGEVLEREDWQDAERPPETP